VQYHEHVHEQHQLPSESSVERYAIGWLYKKRFYACKDIGLLMSQSFQTHQELSSLQASLSLHRKCGNMSGYPNSICLLENEMTYWSYLKLRQGVLACPEQ